MGTDQVDYSCFFMADLEIEDEAPRKEDTAGIGPRVLLAHFLLKLGS